MIYLTLIAVIAVVALQFFGAVPDASVGGPMTLMLIFFIAALAAGIHDAWTHRRGVLGWIVSLVVAVVGGFLGAMLGSTMMEFLLTHVDVGGSLASTRHPLLYITSAAMMLLVLSGAWLALWFVNRLR